MIRSKEEHDLYLRIAELIGFNVGRFNAIDFLTSNDDGFEKEQLDIESKIEKDLQSQMGDFSHATFENRSVFTPSTTGKSVIALSEGPTFSLCSIEYTGEARPELYDRDSSFEFFLKTDHISQYPRHKDILMPYGSAPIGGCHYAVSDEGIILFGDMSGQYGYANGEAMRYCLTELILARKVHPHSHIFRSEKPLITTLAQKMKYLVEYKAPDENLSL